MLRKRRFLGLECSYGKIFIPFTEISVAKTGNSVTGPARLLIWTHRKFYEGNSGEARPGSYEEAPTLWNEPDSKGEPIEPHGAVEQIVQYRLAILSVENFRLPGILTYRTDRLKMCIDGINFELYRNDLCRKDFVSNRPDTAWQNSGVMPWKICPWLREIK